jgi:hypothetical protein
LFVTASSAGLITVPLAVPSASENGGGETDRLTRARLHGQRLVQMARALKEAGSRNAGLR